MNAGKVDISPRKDTDRGGFLCLPLAENLSGDDVKARHPEWERMKCPNCGRECWKPAGVEELQEKQGVQLLCTMCALEAGLVAPYRKHKEPKPGGNRAQRRSAKHGKQR